MNVSLTPHLEEFVRMKVETGRYSSSSEVVREALRLLEQREQTQQEKLDALRRDIQEGIDSGDSGPFDAEELKRMARSRRDARG